MNGDKWANGCARTKEIFKRANYTRRDLLIVLTQAEGENNLVPLSNKQGTRNPIKLAY